MTSLLLALTDVMRSTDVRSVKVWNDAELRFLILHENYHKLARHLHIYYGLATRQTQRRVNMAVTSWINHKLVEDNKDDKFATATGALTIGCYSEEYANMSVPEYIQCLYKKKSKVVESLTMVKVVSH